MSNPAILVENLSYSYGDLVAVDGIGFVVAPGEVLGFLGPNGAGKSTTVQMLTGQLRPKGGKAVVLGVDIARDPETVQARIGVCFEQTNLYEQMSALENLNLFARLFGVRDFDAARLIGRVGLTGRERDRVATYSKGMKQRLMVARALVNQPDILFLDEPTDGLDPVSSESIRTLIKEEQARGTTVFLTTHDMLEADKLSDRVAFINEGKIVALDAPHELKQLYGRRALEVEFAGADGTLETREIALDEAGTPDAVAGLFRDSRVVTLHSKEATLEDIFIKITGRQLV
jgi:ABC-2 type transport system ATP-binding protein